MASETLTDIQKYKKYKELPPDIKIQGMSAAAKERVKRMTDGRKAKFKAVAEGREYKKAKKRSGNHVARKMIAELAGISEAQVKCLKFIDRYAPEMLARVTGDEKVSELYNQVWSWYQTLKKHDSDLLKEVTEGKVKLKTAYAKLLKQKASIKPVAKESPTLAVAKQAREIAQKWIKQQHKGKFTPTAAELELMHHIEALLGKYTNNNTR